MAKYYPRSVYEFQCPHCGAKANSRCIIRGQRIEGQHYKRWAIFRHAQAMHGPPPTRDDDMVLVAID